MPTTRLSICLVADQKKYTTRQLICKASVITCLVAVVTSPGVAACIGMVATPVTEISAPLVQTTVAAS